jgi:hypothetical protein
MDNILSTLLFDASASIMHILSQRRLALNHAHIPLGWRPTEAAEISLVGQNLLHPQHFDFVDDLGVIATRDVRKVFAKITGASRGEA